MKSDKTNETKSKILKAASDLLREKGIHALSVRAISTKAGLSTIGIYSHFKGKQGILDALYIEGFEMVEKAVTIENYQNDPKAAVLQATQNYLDLAEEYDAHYRIIFGESDGSYHPSEEAIEAAKIAFRKLTQLVSQLLPDDASGMEKQNAAMKIWALTHGYVSLHHHLVANMIDMKDWKKNVKQSVSALIDGAWNS